jgi:hypothetical protein
MNTSAIDAFINALQEGLSAWEPLQELEVEVYSGPVGDTKNTIQIWDAVSDEEWAAIGMRGKDENIDVRVGIYCKLAGRGEEVIRDVRKRAFDALAEIKNYLHENPEVAGTVLYATLTRHELDQGADQDGRWAFITTRIGGRARLKLGG